MTRWLKRVLVALVAMVGVAVAIVAIWAIDASAHDGRVLRRTTLGGHTVGGLSRAALRPVVAEVADEIPTRQVEVRAPDGGFSVPAREIGLAVDGDATVRAALEVGRTGGLWERFTTWAGSFTADRRAPVQAKVDEDAVYRTVADRDPGPRTAPVEPSIAFTNGAIRGVAGKPGRGIDPAEVLQRLPSAATAGDNIVVNVDRGAIPPRIPVSNAELLAAQMQARLSSTIDVRTGTTQATVPVSMLRSWVIGRVVDSKLQPALDPGPTIDDLSKLLSKAGEPAVETSFSVEGGGVKIIPGRPGTACCAPEAVALVQRQAFEDLKGAPPDLPLTARPPKLSAEDAIKLGVKEPIGSFTTKHAAGQPRVANIHRIADLLRGTLIRPGTTFSVNDTIGKRTTEKGFVSAGVIEDGKFTEDVGGGISQFATTLFNAAFEAGLDFGEYQSHSIYISRYPYGREATLSFPAPDLQIENNSKWGVLLWPTYTDKSITVTLYSTRFADSRQTGQSEGKRGNCTRVTTERTRTFLDDGRTEVDKVFATYRPSEGVNC